MAATPVYDSIIFSPHPDDVVFSIGATLLAGCLGATRIINVFSRSRYTVAGLGHEEEISSRRILEDARAMEKVKADADYWNYPDSSVKRQYADESHYMDAANRPANDEYFPLVHERIKTELSTNSNALFLAPLGLGYHIDHSIIAAVCAMLPHSTIAYYEDGSYFTGNPEDAYRHATALNLHRAITLDPGNLADKIGLAMLYESQFDNEIRTNLESAYRHCGGERIWCTKESESMLLQIIQQHRGAGAPAILFSHKL